MTKTCKTCRHSLSLDQFSVNYVRNDRYGRLKTYYKPDCKPCTANLARYRRKHKQQGGLNGV